MKNKTKISIILSMILCSNFVSSIVYCNAAPTNTNDEYSPVITKNISKKVKTYSQNTNLNFDVPSNATIDKVTVDNGTVVNHTKNGTQLTVNVDKGKTLNEYNPRKYKKENIIDYKKGNTSHSFDSSINYSQDGYSGTLYKNGDKKVISGDVITDKRNATDYEKSSINSFSNQKYYKDGDGYDGYLNKDGNSFVSSGQYIPPIDKNVSHESSYSYDSTWSIPPSYYYSDYDGYRGTIPLIDTDSKSTPKYKQGPSTKKTYTVDVAFTKVYKYTAICERKDNPNYKVGFENPRDETTWKYIFTNIERISSEPYYNYWILEKNEFAGIYAPELEVDISGIGQNVTMSNAGVSSPNYYYNGFSSGYLTAKHNGKELRCINIKTNETIKGVYVPTMDNGYVPVATGQVAPYSTMAYTFTFEEEIPGPSIPDGEEVKYKGIYKGIVTKPASDTREYRQNYKGEITKVVDTREWQQDYIGTIYKGGMDDYWDYNVDVTYSYNAECNLRGKYDINQGNILDWTINDDPSLYNYQVYRDGVYIATTSNLHYVDSDGQDKSAPDPIDINTISHDIVEEDDDGYKVRINFKSSKDNGTSYKYFVVPINKTTGQKIKSNTIDLYCESGIKEYTLLYFSDNGSFDVKTFPYIGSYKIYNFEIPVKYKYDTKQKICIQAHDYRNKGSAVTNYIFQHSNCKIISLKLKENPFIKVTNEILFPVSNPIPIKNGYLLDFDIETKNITTMEMSVFANGTQIPIYDKQGNKYYTLSQDSPKTQTTKNMSFYVKDLPKGTILDIKLKGIYKNNSYTKELVNNDFGLKALKIDKDYSEDIYINQTN